MVMRKVLSATVGRRSTRSKLASSVESAACSKRVARARARARTSRACAAACRAAPSSGMSMGRLPKCASSTIEQPARRWRCRPPRTGSARADRAPRSARAPRRRSPARSAPAPRCTRSRAATCRARRWAPCAARSCAPRPASWTSSGSAFERPPAPTSWIETMGFVVAERPAAVDHLLAAPLHLGVVALHRGEIEVLVPSAPAAMDEAAPPPRPISIAGPPSTTMAAPGGISRFCTCSRADVAEAAGDHDGLVVAAHLASGVPVGTAARRCGSSRSARAARTRC